MTSIALADLVAVRQQHVDYTLAADRSTVLELRWTDPSVRVHLGMGISLERGQSIAAIGALSLMPSYCWDRIPPQEFGGVTAVASYYQKLPGVIFEGASESAFVELPAWLRAEAAPGMTFQSVTWDDRGGVLRLLCPVDYEAWQTPKARFAEWVEGAITSIRQVNRRQEVNGSISLRARTAPDLESLLELLATELLEHCAKKSPALESAATRAATYLAQSMEPRSGVLVEWKRRDRPGFKGTLSLFTYNRGLASIDPDQGGGAARLHAAIASVLSDPRAMIVTRWGRAWHNSVTLGIPFGRKFFTHLGAGIGGYPGGSATALRAIGEAMRRGRAPSATWTQAVTVARTLATARRELGYWPLDLSTPVAAAGPGVIAEAALGLLEVGSAGHDPSITALALADVAALADSLNAGSVVSGYLRDNRPSEPDGVSWIFILAAATRAAELSGEARYARLARSAARALVRWIRVEPVLALDPVAYSFSPRIAPCEGFWAAEALANSARVFGDESRVALARALFAGSDCEPQALGFSEAVYVDREGTLHPHHFACGYTAFAALDAARSIADVIPPSEAWQPLGSWAGQAKRQRVRERVLRVFAR